MSKWWNKQRQSLSTACALSHYPIPHPAPQWETCQGTLGTECFSPRIIDKSAARGELQLWVHRDLTKGKSWSLENIPPKRDVSGKKLKAKLCKQLWKFIAMVLPIEAKIFLSSSDLSSDFKPPSILPQCALVCGFLCIYPARGL